MSGFSPLAAALLEIKKAVRHTRDELGWMYSNTRRIEGYPDSPETKQDIEARLAHLSAGLTCVYAFAVVEEFIDPRSTLWNQFLNLISPNDRAKLKAFKHIRNTIAHGFDGTRASRNAADFNTVMNRPNTADRIQSVERWDANTITLKHHAGWECFDFVEQIVEQALQKAANP